MSGRWIAIAGGLLALATAASGAAALAALNSGGEARVGGVTLLRLAAGYDRAAEASLRRATEPAMAREAERLSRQALQLNPYDTGAWLRIAFADAASHGDLTSVGVQALRHSYDLAEIDPYVARWRVGFTLDHWQRIPADLREQVRTEAMALGRQWQNREKVRETLKSVRNPAGRLPAAMWLARIDQTVAE